MVLIVVYILSAVSVLFVDSGPLRIAGVFICFCYIPGLCFFTFVKREKLSLEDLFLAFPCSIGISSALIIGLLYIGVYIGHILDIINIIAGFLVLLYIITRSKKNPYRIIKLHKQEIVFCFLALLVTLLLFTPVLLGSEKIAISAHGFMHSSIVTQIMNGIFPPENPGLGGTYQSYHWGFHAFIATLSASMNFHALRIISVLNLVSLFMIFYLTYRSAKVFKLSEGYCYLASLSIIGLMRTDAWIFLALKLISWDFQTLQKLDELIPWDVFKAFILWSKHFPFGDLRMLFLSKFYNANAMPLAVCLSLSYILIMLLLLKRNHSDKYVYLMSIGSVLVANIFIYMPLSIFPLIHIPVWAGFIFLSNHRSVKEKLKETSEILLPYIIAVLLTLPYLFFVVNSGPVGKGQIISFDLYSQSFKNLFVFWLPFPLIIIGIWIAIKRVAFSREIFFLLTGTLLCTCLTVFMHLPLNNSYKFTYILVFFFALFFVFALSNWLKSVQRRWLKGFITVNIIIILLSNPILVGSSYMLSYWFRDTTYTFSGSHIMFTNDNIKNDLYTWIRENTPPEALIMLTYLDPVQKNLVSLIPEGHYKPAALTERNLFILKDKNFTTGNPEYAKRVVIRKLLFEDSESPELTDFFTSLNRPLYLLVEGEFSQLPEKAEQGLLLMFHNEEGRVYLLRDKLPKNTT